MAIKIYKPTTAARRNSSVNAYVELTKWEPEKSLIERRKKTGGRNHTGWITRTGSRPRSLPLNMIRIARSTLPCWNMLTTRSGTFLLRWR